MRRTKELNLRVYLENRSKASRCRPFCPGSPKQRAKRQSPEIQKTKTSESEIDFGFGPQIYGSAGWRTFIGIDLIFLSSARSVAKGEDMSKWPKGWSKCSRNAASKPFEKCLARYILWCKLGQFLKSKELLFVQSCSRIVTNVEDCWDSMTSENGSLGKLVAAFQGSTWSQSLDLCSLKGGGLQNRSPLVRCQSNCQPLKDFTCSLSSFPWHFSKWHMLTTSRPVHFRSPKWLLPSIQFGTFQVTSEEK